jgi:ATP-binding cassette subfamily G (WHITE) protein 2
VFINVGTGPAASFQRLAILFFVMLLFELLPFCYMSFYVADRKFYASDVAAGLYHPSAYYLAQMLAGKYPDTSSMFSPYGYNPTT